jgi:hypothetical protein
MINRNTPNQWASRLWVRSRSVRHHTRRAPGGGPLLPRDAGQLDRPSHRGAGGAPMPGCQARMSGTPPQRRFPRRHPFVLDSPHGPRPASRVRLTGRIVTSPPKLAPLLTESWRLPACINADGHGGRAAIHGKDGATSRPLDFAPRLGARPLVGSGVAVPQGALHAIDSSARPPLSGPRPAPPSAAPSLPWLPPRVVADGCRCCATPGPMGRKRNRHGRHAGRMLPGANRGGRRCATR